MRIGKTGPSNTRLSRHVAISAAQPVSIRHRFGPLTQEQESVCRSCGGSMADLIRFPLHNFTLTRLVS
jgi:hypothetical protein